MPLTPSQKSAAFRTRKAERIARMEAALREIAEADYRRHDVFSLAKIAATALAKPTNT